MGALGAWCVVGFGQRPGSAIEVLWVRGSGGILARGVGLGCGPGVWARGVGPGRGGGPSYTDSHRDVRGGPPTSGVAPLHNAHSKAQAEARGRCMTAGI